ncbi:MAG TPA: hypothetical protein VLQ92_07730 [Candidatus Limnocylindrales bacterium]|nr:hypothetical protein [Candidatus Limnocylindrales bacterium]
MPEVMRRERSGVAGGLILIGVGVLLLTGWWWPGIMVVIGVALAAERWLSGSAREAIMVLGIFLAIPVGIAVMTSIDIPWIWVIALVLIGLGASGVVKAMSAGPPG